MLLLLQLRLKMQQRPKVFLFVRFERKEVQLPDYDKLHIVVDEVEAANLAATRQRKITNMCI